MLTHSVSTLVNYPSFIQIKLLFINLCYLQELFLNHMRIQKIENLEPLTRIERLYLRWNLIKKIENLNTVTTLRELELYDNQITCIENLDCLVNLQ